MLVADVVTRCDTSTELILLHDWNSPSKACAFLVSSPVRSHVFSCVKLLNACAKCVLVPLGKLMVLPVFTRTAWMMLCTGHQGAVELVNVPDV